MDNHRIGFHTHYTMIDKDRHQSVSKIHKADYYLQLRSLRLNKINTKKEITTFIYGNHILNVESPNRFPTILKVMTLKISAAIPCFNINKIYKINKEKV